MRLHLLFGGGLSLATYRSLSNAAPLPPAEAKKEEPAAGPTVNGLKLSLSADKAETVMKPDGKNAEPVALKLTITNVSDKPMRVAEQISLLDNLSGGLAVSGMFELEPVMLSARSSYVKISDEEKAAWRQRLSRARKGS